MDHRASYSRVLAGLLAMAVFVSQTSVVFAALEMFPVDSEKPHCMMMEKQSAKTDTVSSQVSGIMDCCKTPDCASGFCVPAFSSSIVMTSSTILLHHSVYAQSIMDTFVQRLTGTNSDSPYRPPRQSA